MAAYPEIPDETHERVVKWVLNEGPSHLPVLDNLLMEFHTMHKLLSIAYAEEMT